VHSIQKDVNAERLLDRLTTVGVVSKLLHLVYRRCSYSSLRLRLQYLLHGAARDTETMVRRDLDRRQETVLYQPADGWTADSQQQCGFSDGEEYLIFAHLR
jgi:hypothetical protein